MNTLPTPALTDKAHRDTSIAGAERALLATIDGRRNIIQLESVARALGLAPTSIDSLHRRGLIEYPKDTAGSSAGLWRC